MNLIQKIDYPGASKHHVDIFVLRLDLIHPLVSGNKWFKLKYNLQTAINQYRQDNLIELDLSNPDPMDFPHPQILTFGGAYSNHIYATAAAGKLFNLTTIGIIRGEETLPLNPTLDFAQSQGMRLIYVNREIYQQRNTVTFHEEWITRFGDVSIIPEGGCNLAGVRGCTEILEQIEPFDVICLACGTATTLAGVALSLRQNQRVIGFPILKGGNFLKSDIENLINQYLSSSLPIPGDRSLNWELVCDYHFGGYAKVNRELLLFKQAWEQSQGIILDYIYTAKMFYGVIDLMQQGYFQNCRLLLLHTGGLQGNESMEQRNKSIFADKYVI